MNRKISDQQETHLRLKEAQSKAEHLFNLVEQQGIIRSDVSEKTINQEIYDLAYLTFGIRKYWHKRIVRAGKNTLYPYRENPPDLMVQKDDILFLDFGPIFEDWEADFGRTFVIGSSPDKLKLAKSIEEAWQIGKKHYLDSKQITGAELFSFMNNLAVELGYEYGAEHCGHLIGQFPHEKIQGDDVVNYIHPSNRSDMRALSTTGLPREWILEVHFVDRKLEIGGFFEQLLTVE